MSWPASFFVAILTAAVGLFVSGFVANQAVGWYRVSGFEGGAGYFVVSLALLGMLVGFVLGLIVSRMVAATAQPGFVKALSVSVLAMCVAIGTTGTVARLMADVPPKIDGEALLLAVEMRYPASRANAPPIDSVERAVRLGSENNQVMRASEKGPLWMEDRHLVDGRWVVPGAVEVFTSRGHRVLDIVPDTMDDGSTVTGVRIPLPAWPGKIDMQWTEWMPRAGTGAPPLPDSYQFRYRVQKRGEPARTETFGPFEVVTIANGFFESQVNGIPTWNAVGEFAIRYRGQPVVIEGATTPNGTERSRFERADAVSAISGTSSALLVHVDVPQSSGYVYLLRDDNNTLRTEFVDESIQPFSARELTSDSVQFHRLNEREYPRGRFDRTMLTRPGLYLFEKSVLDTRNFVVHHFIVESKSTAIPSVRPLALSPDEKSFVELRYADGSDTTPVLVVTNMVANTTYERAIDARRMRFAKLESLDPAWLAHHFVWKRDAGGVDMLEVRPGFVPIPWRGELSTEAQGQQSYRIEKSDEALRGALVEFLVSRFGAVRIPVDSGAYQYPLRIDGRIVNVANSGDFKYVMVSMENGHRDDGLVARIGKAFDEELKTGKYDGMFGK